MKIQMPIRIESEANKREHWAVRNKRKVKQQSDFSYLWRNAKLKPSLPCTVIFTRYANRILDDDNCIGGFKAVRDQLAKEIGIDDGSDLISFKYRQEKLSKREYYITVEILET